MSEWNLSVRLTGQGSDLATTLKESAKEARKLTNRINEAKRALTELRAEAANGITVRLDVDGDHLRSDVTAALNDASAGQGLRVRLDIDGDHLRDDVNTALTAAGAGQGIRTRLDIDGDHLRDDISTALTTAGAGQGLRVRLDLDADHLRDDVDAALNAAGAGQGLGVNLRLTDTMQLRREVEDAVRWAAWGHRIEIPIGLADPMQLRRDVTAAALAAQANQTITLRVQADTSALNRLGNTINGGGNSGGGISSLRKDLVLLAQALIPVAAATIPVAQGLAAAGAGATAFGIAVAGQLVALAEAAEAQTKYQDAVDQYGASSQQAAKASKAYQIALAKLPPATREAAAAFADLKDQYKGWSDALAGDTMEPVTKSLQLTSAILPKLTPMVSGAADEFDRLVTFAGGEMASPGFDRLMNKLSGASTNALHEIVNDIIRLSTGAADFEGGDDLQAFMDYCRQNGPLVAETLQNLVAALIHIVAAGADTGVSILQVANAFAKLVNAIPPGLLSALVGVYTSLRLVSLGMAAVTAVASSAALARLGAYFTLMRTAGVAPTLRATAGSMTGLQKAAAGLGVLGVAAIALDHFADKARGTPPDVDRLTTSLRQLGETGKFTGELKDTFGSLDGLVERYKKLQTESKKTAEAQEGVFGFRIPVADDIADWVADKASDLIKGKDSLHALSDEFDSVDKALAKMASSGNAKSAAAGFDIVKEALRGTASPAEIDLAFNDYQAALADLKIEQEIAARSMGLFGKQAISTKTQLDAQKASADGLRQSIVALNDVNRAGASAMSAFEQSLDDAAAATKGHGEALKIRDGELDLGSEKAREAEKVLSGLAANTDAAATAARDQGKSWEYVNGIYSRGKDAFIEAADAMGLTKTQAEALSRTYLSIPDKKSTVLEMRTEDAVAGLNSVIAAIQKTPGKKSVTVNALTADAIGMLRDLGFKVTKLKDGRFRVTADTDTAKQRLKDVQAARDGLKNKSITLSVRDLASAQARAIQAAIDAVRGKSVTLTTVRHTINVESTAARNAKNYQARGSVLDFYADGGIQRGGIRHFAAGAENHVAQIAPAGSWRVWGEPETGGESYIPLSPTKRPRSRAIAEETVRRLGGDPDGIAWNAAGSVTDWRYDPQTGSLYSASDAGQAGQKTRKVKVKGKGGKVTIKEVAYFDLGAVEKKIKSAAKATTAWNADLEKVADRVGGDVAEALAAMGKDGMKLADKMANGSTKYINEMAAALRNLQKTAKASLTDYTRQLGKANTLNKTFSDNLAKLAAQGFGDLAGQLAAQNDEAAQQLAAAAVKDPKKAAAANSAAKTANTALTADEVGQLVQIIAAIKTSKTGIHDVAATTLLGEDDIITVANKARAQIKSSLGSRADRFIGDLKNANAGKAYENGGIRAGMYATQAGIIRFAEPSTGGEAYLPLGADKRRHAMPVLADVARRFGVGLTDAQGSRVVVIREQGPMVGASHFHIGERRSDRDLAREIESRQAYQLRRLSRGGAFAGSTGGSR